MALLLHAKMLLAYPANNKMKQIIIYNNGIRVYHSNGEGAAFISADALCDAIIKYSNILTEQPSNVEPVIPDKENGPFRKCHFCNVDLKRDNTYYPIGRTFMCISCEEKYKAGE